MKKHTLRSLILSLILTPNLCLVFAQVPAPKSAPKVVPKKATTAISEKPDRAKQAPPPADLSVDEVVQLVEAGVSEDLVITKIKKTGKAFDLSTADLLKLKKTGISENIIKIMMDPQAVVSPSPATQPQALAVPASSAAPKPSSESPPSDQHSPSSAQPRPENLSSRIPFEKPKDYDDFKRLLKERYDGKTLAPVVSGLMAGEFKKGFIPLGAGDAGLLWYHYHESVPVPDRKRSNPLKLFGKKTSDMDQLDARTFADLEKGLNVVPLEKGEPLKVHKFYIMPDHIEFNLVTTSLGHLKNLDINKASTETTTRVSGNEAQQTVSVGDIGLRFRFFFDKEKVLNAADYAVVVSEINRYLLPKEEAEQLLQAEKNVEIEPGMSEEVVVQKLGAPQKTLRVGTQKSLKYKDMTVILKDGKVAEVKLE